MTALATSPRYRLVLAEDDDALRETVAEILSAAFEVVATTCAEEAVETLAEEPADLALFDVQMGSMSGLDAVRVVRLRYELQLPCLLMTARSDAAVRQEAARWGVSDLIEKPFARLRLIETVATTMAVAYGEQHVADWFDPHCN